MALLSIVTSMAAKKAAKTAGAWILSAAKWLVIPAVIWYIHTAEQNRADVKSLRADLKESNDKIGKVQQSFTQCKAVNQANKAAADEQERQLQEKLAHVAVLRATANRDIEDIHAQADAIRGKDTVCRTLDDDLPESFVAGVRRPPG